MNVTEGTLMPTVRKSRREQAEFAIFVQTVFAEMCVLYARAGDQKDEEAKARWRSAMDAFIHEWPDMVRPIMDDVMGARRGRE